MLTQRDLDLGRCDVEPACDDELLDAVDDAHESGLVDRDDVAGAEPAVGEDLLGLFGLAVVAAEHLRSAHDQLSSLTRLDILRRLVGIDDTRSVPGSGSPTVPGTRCSATGFAISTGEHSLSP